MFQPSTRRAVRRGLLILTLLTALVAGTTSIATADPVTGGNGGSGGTNRHAQLVRKGAPLHYAIAQPNCSAPTAGHRSCLSERLKQVAKGTPGALAYTAPAYGLGPSGYGFTPADLASAYGFDPSAAAGAGQTVALIDAYDDPNAEAELDLFDAQYGLPAETASSFRKVNQRGATAPLPTADAGWAGEIALDIEAVRGVCHRCHILLVEADSDAGTDLDAAVDEAATLGATEISNSYGGSEWSGDGAAADEATYDHPGIVITAATGDDGWEDWDYANDAPAGGYALDAPEVPAAYPTVVAVGGTALALNADGSRQAEEVWDEDGVDDRSGLRQSGWQGDQGASGSGCSTLYRAPAFQASVKGYAAVGCGAMRSTNDLSVVADPNTGFDVVTISGGTPDWEPTGGTSLAAPLVAAMWALAGGAGGVAYPAENLYDHLRTTPSAFYDVRQGGNGFCGGDALASCESYLSSVSDGAVSNPNAIAVDNGSGNPTWLGLLDCGLTRTGTPIADNRQCNAGPGYDGPSGVGTPAGLAGFRPLPPTATVAWPSLVRPGVAATFRASGFTDPVMKPVATYTWSWGDGTTTTTRATSLSHRYARGGTYTVSLRVTDQLGHASAPITKSYVVGKAPTVKITGPKKVRRHRLVTFKAAVSDPNTGGHVTGYTWRIGAKVVGHGASLKHRFPKKGKAKVRVNVTDDSGLSATSAAHKVRIR